MQLKFLKTFVGPSIYSPRPGITLSFTLPDSVPFEIGSFGDDFRENLVELLKRLHLRPGMDTDILKASNLGDLLVAFALQLQHHSGDHVERGRVVANEPSGRCLLFYECETSSVGVRAGSLAGDLIAHLLSQSGHSPPLKDFDPPGRLKKLISFVKDHGLGGQQRYLMEAARDAGFPSIDLTGGWLQLGHGRYRRLLNKGFTDATPWTAVRRSTDKVYTNQLLRGLGLLVPAQRVVRTPKQAIEAARAIGFPVVVKPSNQDRQVGVTVGIESESELATAFEHARKYSSRVIIEELLKGENYRAIVIDGAIVSAVERHRAHVVGDGDRTVAELVDIANSDPRRSHSGSMPLVLLELDAEAHAALAAQDYTQASVPKAGERVILSQFPYARVSDETRDVTDIIHPELGEAMLLGVRALGLDIAGVDYITPDITRPPAEVGGGFCEINCTPMLQPHYATVPRDIASPIFNMLFADGRPKHVPIVAICGEGRRSHVQELLKLALADAGYVVGSATRAGLWAAGKRLTSENATGPTGARTLLQDPRIDAAILETPIRVVVGQGLGIDACDVAIIEAATTRDANELPPTTVQALETLVNLARRAVVIDVDHPLCDKLAQGNDAGKFIVVSMRPNTPDLEAHLSSDRAAVVFDGEADPPAFTLIKGNRPEQRILCPELDQTDGNGAHIRATAFAIAGALALDISADAIARRAAEVS